MILYLFPKLKRILFLLSLGLFISFSFSPFVYSQNDSSEVHVGAERSDLLLPLIEGKRIAIIGNQTSTVENGELLPEFLLRQGVNVVKLFSPEHGFRGDEDAGASVLSSMDKVTGLPIVSLYGNKKKPSSADLHDVDVLLFDLQDVGTRFYTYISTMHYAMEAAAEHDVLFIVLDRPNPNDFVAGPILEMNCQSFIGMHPIPLLHGLTVGELALMINGECWLKVKGGSCNLVVIPIKGWRHGDYYSLPVPPSPNLRSNNAIRLYPSLCLFEATILSVGRGTENPFTMLGYPDKRWGKYSFKPLSRKGAYNPKHNKKVCYGEDFSVALPQGGFDLSIFIRYHYLAKSLGYSLVDRRRTFELLIGNKKTLLDIEQGKSVASIEESWKTGLDSYKKLRAKYIIYEEK